MTYMQEAYDALIKSLKEDVKRAHAENDAYMHANTLREKVLMDFIYKNMGKTGSLKAAALVDAHEKKERGDPTYDYGYVECVECDYK